MNKAKITGIVLAVSAAAAFAFAPAVSSAKQHNGSKMVHCGDVNSCKGKSGCKGKENSCKGKNSCEKKGWVPMSDEACQQIGGTPMEKSTEK